MAMTDWKPFAFLIFVAIFGQFGLVKAQIATSAEVIVFEEDPAVLWCALENNQR
jgi:hypothetical protein